MLDVLNQLSSLFRAIVTLVGSCFAFLPDWCLLFMGSVFAFSVAFLIFKFVIK